MLASCEKQERKARLVPKHASILDILNVNNRCKIKKQNTKWKKKKKETISGKKKFSKQEIEKSNVA